MRIVAYYHEEIDGNVTRKSVGLEKRETVVDEPLVLERDALARIAELEEWQADAVELLEKQHAELAALKAQEPCNLNDAQVLEFLGVALRNVDIVGSVRLSEIRQGFEHMRKLYAAPVVSADKKCAHGNWIDCAVCESPTSSVSAEQQVVADGWQLVPVRPTSSMTWVGQSMRYESSISMGSIYCAMLAAAPAPSTTEGQGDE